MKAQSDTFLGIIIKKVLSIPIPIYQFKQPRRLSSLELPYELVLVSDIDATIREVPVDLKDSMDSWFLGYHWNPIVCGDNLHVGWKFQENDGKDYFYALIVSMKEKEDEGVVVSSFAEGVMDMVAIGARAPKWMVSTLSSMQA